MNKNPEIEALTAELMELCNGKKATVVISAALALACTTARQLPDERHRNGFVSFLREIAKMCEQQYRENDPQPDGRAVRKAPDLTVHDGAGARSMRREPANDC